MHKTTTTIQVISIFAALSLPGIVWAHSGDGHRVENNAAIIPALPPGATVPGKQDKDALKEMKDKMEEIAHHQTTPPAAQKPIEHKPVFIKDSTVIDKAKLEGLDKILKALQVKEADIQEIRLVQIPQVKDEDKEKKTTNRYEALITLKNGDRYLGMVIARKDAPGHKPLPTGKELRIVAVGFLRKAIATNDGKTPAPGQTFTGFSKESVDRIAKAMGVDAGTITAIYSIGNPSRDSSGHGHGKNSRMIAVVLKDGKISLGKVTRIRGKEKIEIESHS